MKTYGNWDNNDACLIYSPLRPESKFDLSDRQVELFHKTRGNEEIVMLINHSNEFRDTTLYASKDLILKELHEEGGILSGNCFHVQLPPAGIKIFNAEN